MKVKCQLGLLCFLLWCSWPIRTQAQVDSACPQPVLARLIKHRVAPNETLETIAQRYNLLPTTLIGFNPGLRTGSVRVGSELVVPPSNGIRVEVRPGLTWRDVAASYQVRPDLLFEANGCLMKPSRVVFIPGVNWSPLGPGGTQATAPTTTLNGYPLPFKATIGLGYGWQLDEASNQVTFHSGIDLLAPAGTPVLTAGDGVVAFAGSQNAYGNLVVINHQAGRQTRYAQLASLRVKTGQKVKAGQILGTVGSTGSPSSTPSHLHFEIRINSSLGWVAEDPNPYFRMMKVGQTSQNIQQYSH